MKKEKPPIHNIRETYTVEQKRDSTTGRLLREVFYNAAGEKHRDGEPSVIEYDAETGKLDRVVYYKNGVEHRDDGPATISYDPETGNVMGEFWMKDGKEHREGALPSTIMRDIEGNVYCRRYCLNGEIVAPEINGFTANGLIPD